MLNASTQTASPGRKTTSGDFFCAGNTHRAFLPSKSKAALGKTLVATMKGVCAFPWEAYNYASQNPAMWIDPTGQKTIKEKQKYTWAQWAIIIGNMFGGYNLGTPPDPVVCSKELQNTPGAWADCKHTECRQGCDALRQLATELCGWTFLGDGLAGGPVNKAAFDDCLEEEDKSYNECVKNTCGSYQAREFQLDFESLDSSRLLVN